MKKWFLCTVLLIISITSIEAHESRPAYLELQQRSGDVYDVLWKVPAKGPYKRLSLHVLLPDDCTIVEPARSSFTGGAFVERSAISRIGGLEGTEIAIDGLSATLTDVLVRIGRLDGSTQVVQLKPSNPSFIVEASPTKVGVARTYFVLGIQHIWQGIDHLLFVACLILIAGTGKRILITITGFTVAHSITLAMAALNLVRVPIVPVEACIALSIVFLATEIARKRRDTLTWRYPITVSVAFGLLHGLGFASALGEIGLPQTEIPTALLCFNLGVEAGQILFVLGVLVLLSIVKVGGAFVRPVFPYASIGVLQRLAVYTIGTTASFWMFQRALSF